MKTVKEYAEELVNKMYFSRRYKDSENYISQQAWVHAKQCALIAVDEIIEECDSYKREQYWLQVKQEIEKL